VEVLVAGGRGFVGRHTCAWLAERGDIVHVAGRGDPLDRGGVVVHLGLFDEATAIAAVAQLRGRPLVAASSGDVYFAYDQLHGRESWDGVQPGPLSEDAPLRTQLYPYGRRADAGGEPKRVVIDYDKILVERVVLAAGGTVLRLPKVWGAGDTGTLVTTALRKRLAGEPVVVARAHASWRWTHGYVDDVAHAIGLAARAPRNRVYNVGERDTPTLAERLQAVIADEASPELRVPIAHAVDLVMATDRIRAELGYAEIARDPIGETLTALRRP
jgi:nucleoside-diphosphate-sugar epimerase